MRTLRILFSITCLSAFSTAVWAEACTYSDALMALEQGNAVRGMALMRMASNDGDLRARQFLAEKDHVIAEVPVDAVVRQAGADSRSGQDF